MSEFDKKVQALQAVLVVAKERREENPGQLMEIMPQVFQALTTIYEGMYQWYISIGSPGGESREEFNAWLGTARKSDEVG